jgi:hypothetical protein
MKKIEKFILIFILQLPIGTQKLTLTLIQSDNVRNDRNDGKYGEGGRRCCL